MVVPPDLDHRPIDALTVHASPASSGLVGVNAGVRKGQSCHQSRRQSMEPLDVSEPHFAPSERPILLRAGDPHSDQSPPMPHGVQRHRRP